MVQVAIDGEYAGYILIADEIKDDARTCFRCLGASLYLGSSVCGCWCNFECSNKLNASNENELVN